MTRSRASRASKAECSGDVATAWDIAAAKLAPPRAICLEPHRHPSGEAETADRASEGKLEARQLLSARVRCPPATGGRLGLRGFQWRASAQAQRDALEDVRARNRTDRSLEGACNLYLLPFIAKL